MGTNVTPRQKLEVRQSERRQKLNELAGVDKLDDTQRTELDTLTAEYADGERQYRAAILAEDTDTAAAKAEAEAAGEQPDAEKRARLELRGRVEVSNYFLAFRRGADVTGAELELRQELGLQAGQVPLEALEPKLEHRADVATTAPTTGLGVNVDLIRPAIFARSIAGRLGVEMPQVSTGTYSTMTVSASLTAAARAAGADAGATAAVLTPLTTDAHGVSARLSVRQEDILKVGASNYSEILRGNLMLAFHAQLDQYLLNGTGGTTAEPQGLIGSLDNPTDPTAVVDWDGFVTTLVNGIDGGPWAETLRDVKLVVNAETMRLAESTFPKQVGAVAAGYTTKDTMAAARYLREHSGGIVGHSRMPATASSIAPCIRYRNHTMGLDNVNAMRTAVCPVWAYLTIEDPYTGSASATNFLTVHAWIGDVLLEQPSAYERVDLKVS